MNISTKYNAHELHENTMRNTMLMNYTGKDDAMMGR